MAGQTLNTLFAQTFQLASALGFSVTDSFGSRSPTVAAAWYRFLLVASAYTGATADDPKDLLAALEAALNATTGGTPWTVRLRPDGKVRITWVGGTGGATITWTNAALRYLLGFSASNTSSFPNPGNFVDGADQPLLCVFSHNARKNSSGRVPIPRRAALAHTQTGKQYGAFAGKAGVKITLDIGTHPLDSAAKTTLNANATNAPGTVAWPDDEDRARTPSRTPAATLLPPWSLVDFFNTVHVWGCGVALGNYAAILGSTSEPFWNASVDAKTLKAEDALVETRPGFALLVDWKRVTLRLIGKATRA